MLTEHDDIKLNYYGCAKNEDLEDSKNQILWQQQRLERGFDDTELWSLDETIIRFILPRLIEFRKTVSGFPLGVTEHKEWTNILDKIICGFKIKIESDSTNNCPQYLEAKKLLFEWFDYLWD